MDRPQLKLEMRRMLSSHFPFFLLLFLPVLLLNYGSAIAQYLDNSTGTLYSTMNDLSVHSYANVEPIGQFYGLMTIVTVIAIISGLLLIGVRFASIDLIRNRSTFDEPVTKSFTILNNGQYFIGTLIIGILITVLTLLWSLLLIVPGIIKGFSYSQAFYIYRDAIDQGKPIGYLEAITKSRELMNGHKWEYFVLYLSFLGWFILSGFTMGILDLWVLPYYNLALANFYIKLADPQPDSLGTIFDDSNHQS